METRGTSSQSESSKAMCKIGLEFSKRLGSDATNDLTDDTAVLQREAADIRESRCNGNSSSPKKTVKKVRFALTQKNFNAVENSLEKNDEYVTEYVGNDYIENLSKKRTHEIAEEILKSDSPFASAFLTASELEIQWLMLVVKILKNVFSSAASNDKKTKILKRVLHSQLFHAISFYLGDCEVKNDQTTVADLRELMESVLALLSMVSEHSLPIFPAQQEVGRMILKMIKVNKILDVMEEMQLTKRLENLKIESTLSRDMLEPPNHFRSMSLFPKNGYEDLLRNDFDFIRPNIVDKPYQNVEHYLDVQFRLLREDFMESLRRGVREYRRFSQTNVNRYKYDGMRLYPRTKFIRSQTTKSQQLGFVVNFSSNFGGKIDWKNSKRLMVGSLLLFTRNDFETFFHATVLERDEKFLQTGRLVVKLTDDSVTVDRRFFALDFLMAEAEAFFAPYFSVMHKLQTLNANNLAMAEFIVHCARNNVKPKYVQETASSKWEVLGHKIDLLNDDEEHWPSAAQLGMNESQRTAFKTALTSNFCLIQGPPGTGKTFVGLKIMEVLLKNISAGNTPTPILVVCYTNHALDQFLEGIVKFTSKVVRMGSRSSSEILKDFNMRGRYHDSLRWEAKKSVYNGVWLKHEIESIGNRIRILNQLRKAARLKNPRGILAYKVLVNVMNDYQKSNLSDEKHLLNWLLPVDQRASNPDSDDEGENFEAKLATEMRTLRIVNYEDELYSLTEEQIVRDRRSAEDDVKLLKDKLETETNHERRRQLLCRIRDYEIVVERKNRQRSILQEQLCNPCYDPTVCEFISRLNMYELEIEDRWLLYWSWVATIEKETHEKLQAAEWSYASKSSSLTEYKKMVDVYVMQKMDVIGMTTTCAARLHLELEKVKPSIVVVEEAAEVLEAHIIASLTDACQHLILIGDHQQLRPSAAVHELTTKYNFDVSLFERMINNNMYCPMLSTQHRMRPDISRLISPMIYKELENHKSVELFDSVKGVCKNTFFLEHNEYEEFVFDSASKQNPFEVDFLLQLCRYLLYQGYDPSQITILTTYTGQMFLFRREKQQYKELEKVKCVVVDKYQGEENEIILLSLVRSNASTNIGFLKTENRVCVALSRAKQGLYMIGNMDNLSRSPLWQGIKTTLNQHGDIGRKMLLHCQKHDYRTAVSKATDFDLVSEGGCAMPCGELLGCGHTCPSKCHKTDHELIRCIQTCKKTCNRSLHPCAHPCGEVCPPCTAIIKKILPCGHKQNLPCHVDPSEYMCDVLVRNSATECGHTIERKCGQSTEEAICRYPCDVVLTCGHVCPENCHPKLDSLHSNVDCRKICEKPLRNCPKSHLCKNMCFEVCGPCMHTETFSLSCGHEVQLPCCADLNVFKCQQTCEKICSKCENKCGKKCWEECTPCLHKVEKRIEECGHTIRVECFKEAGRHLCTQPCESLAPCGHSCTAMCSEPCGTVKCRVRIRQNDVKALCGHDFVRVRCYQKYSVHELKMESLLKYCDQKCEVVLKCGHVCAGTCGSCRQGRLHKICKKDCDSIAICGHKCKKKCFEICSPCNEGCNYRCKHSQCPSACGAPCVPCEELCESKCEHSNCSAKCGEKCDRKPCDVGCQRKLPCGHGCIGFCGEPCPSKCRVCDSEYMNDWKDEPSTRFVLLEDCGHVVESSTLDNHSIIGEIMLKKCSTCHTPIVTTSRFKNAIIETFVDITQVQKKSTLEDSQTVKERSQILVHDFEELETKYMRIIRLKYLQSFGHVIRSIIGFLIQNGLSTGKFLVTLAHLNAIRFLYIVFKTILSLLDTHLVERIEKESVAATSSTVSFSSRSRALPTVRRTLTSLDVSKILIYLRSFAKEIEGISFRELNAQQAEDIGLEMYKIARMIEFCSLVDDIAPSDDKIAIIAQEIENAFFTLERFTVEKSVMVDGLLDTFKQKVGSTQPLTTINMSPLLEDHFTKERWYKCSEGHYYRKNVKDERCPSC